jgi:hypothetical protein
MQRKAERMSLRRMLLGALGVAAVTGAVWIPACSSEDKLAGVDYDGSAGGSGGTGGVATGPCETGATKSCNIELGKHGDIVSCYLGTQSCENGTWGACEGGTTTTKTIGPNFGLSPQAFSSATNCTNNPCDPYCTNYDEDAGLSTDAGVPLYNWPTGKLSDIPGGLLSKGLKEPCSTSADCQFNTHCLHPVTAGGCAHSKCETGTGFGSACKTADDCISAVCAADPTCCAGTYTNSCNHSICTAGAALSKGCDSAAANCTTTICNDVGMCGSHACSTCCTGTWDADCITAVASKCSLTCPVPSTGNWSAGCVGMVDSVCHATCDTGSPPDESGSCASWVPGETDPTCAGIDLSAGVPCAATVPICNHGQTTAPAGIRVVHFPANSNQYPTCTPDQTKPQMVECYTTKPIAPGYCTDELQMWDGTKWILGCGLTNGNDEVMVNPPVTAQSPASPKPANFAGYVTECNCADNWSLYSGGTCGPPSCAGGTEKVTLKKLNMFVLIDRSGSMTSSGIWTPMVNGMTAFYQQATGIGVAQEYFPIEVTAQSGDGCAWNVCTTAPCANPMIPLGDLVAASAPTDTQEDALIASFAPAYPTGGAGTPTYPALAGAEQWAIANQTATPSEQWVVVLLTDGDPTNCNSDVNQIGDLASAAYASNGIKTYVIGLPGSTTSVLDSWASKGGTGSAVVVTAATMATDLLSTFQSIAGAASCTFDLPASGLFDPNDVKLVLTSSSGVNTTLTHQSTSGNCGSGWYFDDNTTPTSINLCPTTCTAINGDPGSSISYNVGCPKGLGPVTYDIPYEGVCPPGSKPTWGFLSYDTTTPGASYVNFKARTATTQAGLPFSVFVDLATAQSTPTDTQVCPMSGPSPCPIDLYSALGLPNAKASWLQLEVTVTPSNPDVPVLNTWQVTYSCPPSE